MKKLLAIVSMFALPVFVFAQNPSIRGQINDVDDVVSRFGSIGQVFITIVITLAILYIIWNVFKYLIAGSEEDKKKGGLAVLYGVIGLFVILSIWGLVRILTNTFQTQTGGSVRQNELPVLPINTTNR